jgi:hypothetical protein
MNMWLTYVCLPAVQHRFAYVTVCESPVVAPGRDRTAEKGAAWIVQLASRHSHVSSDRCGSEFKALILCHRRAADAVGDEVAPLAGATSSNMSASSWGALSMAW